MMRLFRWQYVAPRLLAVIVTLLTIQYILGVVARGRIIQAIEAGIGTKGEVTAARVSYVDGYVVLGGLRIADPRQPMRNLLEAGRCDLTLDMPSFVQRRRLEGDGEVTGLRFFTARAASGRLEGGAAALAPPGISIGEQDRRAARDWLNQLNQRFERDWTQQFESVQLTTDLAGGLPHQCATLARRMQELQRRADDYHSLAAAAERNPLRNGEFFLRLPTDVTALEQQNAALVADIEKLPDTLETARRAIVAARLRDEKLLREQLAVDAPQAGPLAAYLLNEQALGYASEMVNWLQWTRRIVAVGPRSSAPRSRGEDVTFTGSTRSPDLLLRTLTLQGTAQLGGQPVELFGTLTDFTTEPWLLDRPMRLRLKSARAPALDLRATIDRSGAIARDELLVDCRDVMLPPLKFGPANGLQLSLAPTAATVNISLRLEGDQLSGEVQIVQKEAQIAASLGSDLQSVPVAAALQESLANVHSLATRMSLSGTLTEPRLTLWSNVGPAVAEAVSISVGRVADDHARQLMAIAERRINEQLAQLDRQISDGQADLLPQLSTSTRQLEQMAAQYAAPQRLDAERLGRLPADSLFR